MRDEFKILNPPPVPAWRDPKHRPSTGLAKNGLGILSLITLAFAVWPHKNGYEEALSVQIANHDPITWSLFGAMAAVLVYTARKLWKAERYFSSVFCFAALAGLGAIAATDPFSSNHLSAFVLLLLVSLAWIWGIQMETSMQTGSEPKLLGCAIAATLGALACFFSLGVGERMFLLSTLGSINVLFYEHVLY